MFADDVVVATHDCHVVNGSAHDVVYMIVVVCVVDVVNCNVA